MKAAGRWTTLLVLAFAGACGDPDGWLVQATVDGSSIRTCAPQDVSRWKPTWRPPELPRAACTNAQLANVFLACESATSSTSACLGWNHDPANAGCLQCLYSTEDEPTYGPIIYLRNRDRLVNAPGCIALLDGDRSPAGCGAEVQAHFSCQDEACMANCTTFEELHQCEEKAASSVCAQYRPGKVCGDPSMYSKCLDHDSFDDFYVAFARMFCGVPAADGGGTSPDGGAARDEGTIDASLSASHAPREAATSRGWPVSERVVNHAPAGECIGEALRR